MKNLPEVYHKQCSQCNAKVRIVIIDAAAVLVGVSELIWTRVVHIQNRTRRGGRWGLFERIEWLCPDCGCAHSIIEWSPDDQMELSGFGWQDFPQ